MTDSTQKVLQYLDEAHAMELALARELQAQIAMTPRCSYRTLLEKHLRETRGHADRLQTRMQELGSSRNPLELIGCFAQTVAGQVVALGRAPLALVRGSGGEEKVLKNAKDSFAAEALEIATYLAIERLANDVGDDETAQLAASIRVDEERMFERLQKELPKLTDAVVRAEIHGDPSYDLGEIGAVDAVRETAAEVKETAKQASSRAKRTTRQARKVPGVARAEAEIKGALASAGDLPITRYEELTSDEIAAKLPALSQIDLAKIDAYERKHSNRTTILNRIASLRGHEPWPGYDELNVDEIDAVLRNADQETVEKVRRYERTHSNRAGVLRATERQLATASS